MRATIATIIVVLFICGFDVCTSSPAIRDISRGNVNFWQVYEYVKALDEIMRTKYGNKTGDEIHFVNNVYIIGYMDGNLKKSPQRCAEDFNKLVKPASSPEGKELRAFLEEVYLWGYKDGKSLKNPIKCLIRIDLELGEIFGRLAV